MVRLWFVLLAACTTPEGVDQAASPDSGEPELLPSGAAPPRPVLVRVEPPLDPTDADLPDRFIGELAPGQSCPQPSIGWTSRLPFGVVAPPGLRSFCVFERAPNSTTDLATMVSAFDFGDGRGPRLKPDQMAMMASAIPKPLSDLITDEYVHLFSEMARPIPASASAAPTPVRLAIIDTQPTAATGGWVTQGRSNHGYSLANIARTLTCDRGVAAGSVCGAMVTTRLGLDLYKDVAGILRDPARGGDFGSIGLLAEAVRAEVMDWQGGRPMPLVINLSVAWHTEYGGDPANRSAWTPAMDSLYSSLYDATCRGALTFVAAGNRTGSPRNDSGPLHPASWQVFRVEAAECAIRVGGVAGDYARVDDSPLVHAVGGVDERNTDMALSRSGSRPQLVAYGKQASVRLGAGGYTELLTGTSISALIASSAAASVWANQPGAPAATVVAWLQASGVIAGPVDSYFCGTAGLCGTAARVDPCGVVQYVCDPASVGYAGPCAMAPTTPVACFNGVPHVPQLRTAEYATFNGAAAQLWPVFPRRYTRLACGAMTLYSGPVGFSPVPCPLEQRYDSVVQPWVLPQPPTDECPACYLDKSSGEVFLEWPGGFPTMTALTLYTRTAAGVVTSYTTTVVPTGDSVTYHVSPAAFVNTDDAWVVATTVDASYSATINVVP